MNIEFEDIIKSFKKAQDAVEILDRILRYYNIYGGQFDKVPDYDCGFDKGYSLNERIRAYINFDDSE